MVRNTILTIPGSMTVATVLALALAAPVLISPAAAQTDEAVAPVTNMGPGREGTAAAESVAITLSSQAVEIRQILMDGGEVDAEGLEAAARAREIAGQAIEATGILGNPGDTQVTTTRMNSMDVANRLFARIAEQLDIRIAAVRAGDAAAANRARLDVLGAVNELLDADLLGGDMAPGDDATSAPGGAEPILQQ